MLLSPTDYVYYRIDKKLSVWASIKENITIFILQIGLYLTL